MKAKQMIEILEDNGMELNRYTEIYFKDFPQYKFGEMQTDENGEAFISIYDLCNEFDFDNLSLNEIKTVCRLHSRFTNTLIEKIYTNRNILKNLDLGATKQGECCLYDYERDVTVSLLEYNKTIEILRALINEEQSPAPEISNEPRTETYEIWYDSSKPCIYVGNCHSKRIFIREPKNAAKFLDNLLSEFEEKEE